MQNVINSVKKFLASEDGPTAVEYAVMLALIVIVCLTAIQSIGLVDEDKSGRIRRLIRVDSGLLTQALAKCPKAAF